MKQNFRREKTSNYLGVQVVAFGVLGNGILLIFSTLINQLIRHNFRSNVYSVEVDLLIGITLIYLANLIWRRKYTAWMFALAVYAIYIISSFHRLSSDPRYHLSPFTVFKDFILPLVIVVALVLTRKAYIVRSDIRSFGVSLRIIFIVLVVTLCYGIAGFQLMDNSDFNHEISFSEIGRRSC